MRFPWTYRSPAQKRLSKTWSKGLGILFLQGQGWCSASCRSFVIGARQWRFHQNKTGTKGPDKSDSAGEHGLRTHAPCMRTDRLLVVPTGVSCVGNSSYPYVWFLFPFAPLLRWPQNSIIVCVGAYWGYCRLPKQVWGSQKYGGLWVFIQIPLLEMAVGLWMGGRLSLWGGVGGLLGWVWQWYILGFLVHISVNFCMGYC